ncbi:hypothetical protein Tco_1259958 [Tanacetum coccineum]
MGGSYYSFPCSILSTGKDCGKLRDKNVDESWKIIENLALYDHKGWNDSKDHIKLVLIKEEARHPITKNINSISLIRVKEEKNVGNNGAIGESVVEPSKSKYEEPLKEVKVTNEVERRAADKPIKSVRENVTKNEGEEPA